MAVETLNITCVQCPMGCPLTVEMENGEVLSVSGNTCKRGDTYGRAEATHPERVVTSLVNVAGDWHPIPVKTAAPVPRDQVAEVLKEILATEVSAPVAEGDVVVANVAGTGVDVVCCKARVA